MPVLKEKRGKPYAPWNAALFIGAGLGAIAGTGLVRSSSASHVYGPVVAISLVGALLLILSTKFAMRLAVTLAVAAALVSVTWPAVHGSLAIAAAIPWSAIAVDYAFFRESSYQDLMHFSQNLITGLKTAAYTPALLVLRLAIGRQTWQATGFDVRPRNRGRALPASPGPPDEAAGNLPVS